MEQTKHWAAGLIAGDRCLATIRHESDGAKNLINKEVIVIDNCPAKKEITAVLSGADKDPVKYTIPYNELSKLPAPPSQREDAEKVTAIDFLKSEKVFYGENGFSAYGEFGEQKISEFMEEYAAQQLPVRDTKDAEQWFNKHHEVFIGRDYKGKIEEHVPIITRDKFLQYASTRLPEERKYTEEEKDMLQGIADSFDKGALDKLNSRQFDAVNDIKEFLQSLK